MFYPSHKHLLLSEHAVGLKLFLFLRFLKPSLANATDSLLITDSQKNDEIRFQEIIWPVVNDMMMVWQILNVTPDLCGYSIGSCAVPEPRWIIKG